MAVTLLYEKITFPSECEKRRLIIHLWLADFSLLYFHKTKSHQPLSHKALVKIKLQWDWIGWGGGGGGSGRRRDYPLHTTAYCCHDNSRSSSVFIWQAASSQGARQLAVWNVVSVSFRLRSIHRLKGMTDQRVSAMDDLSSICIVWTMRDPLLG